VYRTLLTQYLENYWTQFHQTFGIGAIRDKDECFKFWDQKVIVQGHGGVQDALLALVTGYLENYWTEFHQSFNVDAF